jgi:hypothetical protein
MVPIVFNAGHRKVYRVEANDEWEAQSAASIAAQTSAELWKRRHYVMDDSSEISHAIPLGENVCGWGCCFLKREKK